MAKKYNIKYNGRSVEMTKPNSIKAANVSLIGLFHANDYCKENYVSPLALNLETDSRFTIWNHFHDHDFCQCSTGDYKAKSGYIRYYFRCPGNIPTPETCRQLVYRSDNVLRAGFGDAERVELYSGTAEGL